MWMYRSAPFRGCSIRRIWKGSGLTTPSGSETNDGCLSACRRIGVQSPDIRDVGKASLHP